MQTYGEVILNVGVFYLNLEEIILVQEQYL